MGKKTFMAAIIILSFLVSLVAGMQFVEVAKANPMIYPNESNTDLPTMQIQQPQNTQQHTPTTP